MAPFQPAGARARWRVIYDLLRKLGPGDVLSYEQIGEALSLDPADDRHVIQMAVRRAGREYEEADGRALEAVPNEGYRIVNAPEHLRLAQGQQKRASKALARGHSKVVHVDMSGLEPETRHAFEVVARAFAMQMEFNKRFDVRQKRLEQSLDAMTERTDRTEQEIADLKARLARLEGEQP
jgi:hypothetical protein